MGGVKRKSPQLGDDLQPKKITRGLYTIKKTLKKNLLKRNQTPGYFSYSDKIPRFIDVINDAVGRVTQIVNESWLFANLFLLEGIARRCPMPLLNIDFFKSCFRVVSDGERKGSKIPYYLVDGNKVSVELDWWNDSIDYYNLLRGETQKYHELV